MKSFQTILLIVFAFFVVGAVLIFSGVIGGSKDDNLVSQPVTLWGTVSKLAVEEVLRQSADGGDKFDITYIEKSADTFERELVEALASGKGPDLVLAPHTLILKQKDKFLPLPWVSVPERLFRDSFVEASEVLLETDHSLGLPLLLDPVVMYWNRDMFTKAAIPSAPSTWLEIQLLPERLTILDGKGNISEAAVGLGGVNNINHFKEILAGQIMQTGNAIATRNEVALASTPGADSALRYYVEFANPSLPKYSWNSAKRSSLDEFIAGKLGVYFGLASELGIIKERNPHLNFDVASFPQISSSERRLTYTDVYTLSVLKNSPVTNAAFAVAYRIAMGEVAKSLSTTLKLPSARRDLLKVTTGDPYLDLFQSSAVIAKTWYDPSATVTRNIFADMVESVMIGKSGPGPAVTDAATRLHDLFAI